MSDVPDTQTEICNAALALLGGGKGDPPFLTSYENDTTPNAERCRAQYQEAVENALLRFDWNGADKYLAATDSGADTEDQDGIEHAAYDYAYLPPADCLALRGLVDADREPLTDWAYVNGYVHTDYGTEEFLWRFISKESKYARGLAQCISYELAILLAPWVLGAEKGVPVAEALLVRYLRVILPQAIAQNQKEKPTPAKDTPVADIW
jgi:hypothetical protein